MEHLEQLKKDMLKLTLQFLKDKEKELKEAGFIPTIELLISSIEEDINNL